MKIELKKYYQPAQMTWLWANLKRKALKGADQNVTDEMKAPDCSIT